MEDEWFCDITESFKEVFLCLDVNFGEKSINNMKKKQLIWKYEYFFINTWSVWSLTVL